VDSEVLIECDFPPFLFPVAAKLFTIAAAQRIAANIVKLSELLRKP
jgi:hypothetical protein